MAQGAWRKTNRLEPRIMLENQIKQQACMAV